MSQIKQYEAMAKSKGFSSYQAYLRAMHQEKYRGKKSDWNINETAPKKKPSNFIKTTMDSVGLLHPLHYVAQRVKGIL